MPRKKKNPIEKAIAKKRTASRGKKKTTKKSKVPAAWEKIEGEDGYDMYLSPVLAEEYPSLRYVVARPDNAKKWGVVSIDFLECDSLIEIDPGTYASPAAAIKALDKGMAKLALELDIECDAKDAIVWVNSPAGAAELRKHMGPLRNPRKKPVFNVEDRLGGAMVLNPDTDDHYARADTYLQSAWSHREAFDESVDPIVQAQEGISAQEASRRAAGHLLDTYTYAALAYDNYRDAGIMESDEYGHGGNVAEEVRVWAKNMLLRT